MTDAEITAINTPEAIEVAILVPGILEDCCDHRKIEVLSFDYVVRRRI